LISAWLTPARGDFSHAQGRVAFGHQTPEGGIQNAFTRLRCITIMQLRGRGSAPKGHGLSTHVSPPGLNECLNTRRFKVRCQFASGTKNATHVIALFAAQSLDDAQETDVDEGHRCVRKQPEGAGSGADLIDSEHLAVRFITMHNIGLQTRITEDGRAELAKMSGVPVPRGTSMQFTRGFRLMWPRPSGRHGDIAGAAQRGGWRRRATAGISPTSPDEDFRHSRLGA
jgi:hypothetical protein